jgi:hypothetical protein
MDEKHPVYDTTVLGLLAITVFWLTSLVVNDKLAMWILELLRGPMSSQKDGASEAIARWIAVGVFAGFLGNVLQMISILIFSRTHLRGKGREVLAGEIKDWAERSCSAPALKDAVKESPNDSLFAWIHYSDPRERLITWGRWKLRYAYLAENWIVAFTSGILMGILFRACFPISESSYDIPWAAAASAPYEFRAFVGVMGGVLVVTLCWRLLCLRQENIDADLGMIAAYVAGVLCPGFSNRFLPPAESKDDSQGKPQDGQ